MVLWLFNDSLKCTCKYCVYSSICHFRFPKVVLAHVISEVGTFCTVLLAVSSRTCLPIFIEIDLYLNNTDQKISWHFETPCSINKRHIDKFTLLTDRSCSSYDTPCSSFIHLRFVREYILTNCLKF